MASKSMQELLSTLLKECYVEGTSAHDSGFTVSTDKRLGEKILFFKIDSRHGRAKLSMLDENIKICDYLVFYAMDNEIEEVVCFMELKGKNISTAIKQILDTHEHVTVISRKEIARDRYQRITWKACICLHGSAPNRNQRLEDKLVKKFGKGNIRIKRDVGLGDFLRNKTT